MRAAPALFGLLALALWEGAVRLFDVPVYQLPGPVAIAGAFLADPLGLLGALVSTLAVMDGWYALRTSSTFFFFQ